MDFFFGRDRRRSEPARGIRTAVAGGELGWRALKPSAVGCPISKLSNLDHSFWCGGIICVAFVGAQGNRLSAGAVFGCDYSNV